LTPGGDDPFGRQGEERTDPFGRPIEEERKEGSLWSGGTAPVEEPPAPEAPRFLPPTDAPAAPAPQPSYTPPAPSAPPATSSAPPPENLASYMERAGAAVIDFFVRAGIALAFVIVMVIVAPGDDDAAAAALLIGFYVLAPFYAPVAMSRWNGQTLGHRAVGTRIVTRKGEPVTGGKAVVREFLTKHLLVEIVGGLLSFGVFAILNYLWPLWDKRNEALHDKMCDTLVVKA
jgi:uncharacterized RDD family membrane protein YckC